LKEEWKAVGKPYPLIAFLSYQLSATIDSLPTGTVGVAAGFNKGVLDG